MVKVTGPCWAFAGLTGALLQAMPHNLLGPFGVSLRHKMETGVLPVQEHPKSAFGSQQDPETSTLLQV